MEQKYPLVSVIMPAFNAEKYIGKAIESILCQTYKEIELIIIEDCSHDGTLEVIERIKDSRIKIVKNQKNSGIAYSTNRGIKESNGKYIALLDDDDEAFPNRIKLQVDYMESHLNVDILGGRLVLIDSKENIIKVGGIPRYNPKYIKAMLLFQNLDFVNGTSMMRKSFLDNNELSYKDGYYGLQDYRFFMEASKVGTISSIKNLLLKWRRHGSNETEYELKKNGKERARMYSIIQKDSIETSGFSLDEKEYSILFKAYAEGQSGRCDTICECEKLYYIMKKMIKQGMDMGIDYQEELEHLCKRKYCEVMMKTDYSLLL